MLSVMYLMYVSHFYFAGINLISVPCLEVSYDYTSIIYDVAVGTPQDPSSDRWDNRHSWGEIHVAARPENVCGGENVGTTRRRFA